MKNTTFRNILVFFILYIVPLFFVANIPIIHLILSYLIISFCLSLLFIGNVLGFLGNFDFARGKDDQASAFYRLAILKDTRNPNVYLNYGILHLKQGNLQDALTHLKTAQALNRNVLTDKNILLTTATCYWALGNINKAILILEQLKSKYDYTDPNALSTLGYMYFLKKDYELATAHTNKAIDEMPTLAPAWDSLGQIYYATSQIERAKNAFIKAISYKKNLVDSNYYLGLIYEKEGNLTLAKKHFTIAYECNITPLNSTTRADVETKYLKY